MREERNDRRLKIAYLPEDQLINILSRFDGRECIEVPVFAELPSDCEVVATHIAYDRRAIGMTLRHESFGIVPDGWVIPEIVVTQMVFVKVDYERQGD